MEIYELSLGANTIHKKTNGDMNGITLDVDGVHETVPLDGGTDSSPSHTGHENE